MKISIESRDDKSSTEVMSLFKNTAGQLLKDNFELGSIRVLVSHPTKDLYEVFAEAKFLGLNLSSRQASHDMNLLYKKIFQDLKEQIVYCRQYLG